jgi:hypothetical protein
MTLVTVRIDEGAEQAASMMELLYSFPTAILILSNLLLRESKASSEISLFYHHGGGLLANCAARVLYKVFVDILQRPADNWR